MRENLWLSCKQKECCYSSLVVVTGRDVYRISDALGTDPWTFLVYFTPPQPNPDSFVLDKSGRHFRLALAKGPTRRKKLPPPCIFLMKTTDGHHRCGLGDLRPQVCRVFPLELSSGVISVPRDTGCTCRAWSLADVDLESDRPLVRQRLDEYIEYCELVQQWNRSVMDLPDDNKVADFYDYCRFLLWAYGDSLAQSRLETAGAQP